MNNAKQSLAVMLLVSLVRVAHAQGAGGDKLVNIAGPDWDTQIEATTAFSDAYAPFKLADGKDKGGPNCWFCRDGATLPQVVTLTFEQPRQIERVKVVQADWVADHYRSRGFHVEVSSDGQSWTQVAEGSLKSPDAGEFTEVAFTPVTAAALRIVITSSYNSDGRPAGLAEVEIFCRVRANEKAPYQGSSPTVNWSTFRGMFTMKFELVPPTHKLWRPATENTETNQVWTSDPYRLNMHFDKLGDQVGVMKYVLTRPDGQSFRIVKNDVEARTSYSSVYKIFTPDLMRQQNYKIDLPHELGGVARVESDTPVIWMQDTAGHNTLTIGMLDQIPVTRFDGSTYDLANGGEAPGIANSYVRVGFKRSWSDEIATSSFSDGIYINADPSIFWYDALHTFADAVDVARNYQPHSLSDRAFGPMWHTWYAHAFDINQAEVLVDAKIAADLGFRTFQIDAGWQDDTGSIPAQGLYDFHPTRFPDPLAMNDKMHAMGLAVVLRVEPSTISPTSSDHAQMAGDRIGQCLTGADCHSVHLPGVGQDCGAIGPRGTRRR